VLAHGLKYVAQSTAGFPDDITNKVKKALAVSGPTYIQILSPCIPGWKINLDQAVKLGKLAVNTGLYPLLEYENGILTNKSKISQPAPRVTEYLKPQGKFKHLFSEKHYQTDLDYIQRLADENIKKYQL
jgi:pyruvate ferredoxin oxidoreductase beta subunit